MPFPLSKVRRFGDYRGQFVLMVQCSNPKCGHERAIAASIFSKRFGRDALVEPIVRRLRCHKCGTKSAEVLIGGIPR